MVVYIFMDGNVKIVSPENVYQGSNVTEITLLAPFPDETSVSVGFELPDGTIPEKQPMSYTQTIIDGQSVRAYVYKLPYAITEQSGNVKMSFIAKFTNGQQTSYMANFEVQESVLPEPPENPDKDTYDLLLQYYQDAKNSAIAAQNAAEKAQEAALDANDTANTAEEKAEGAVETASQALETAQAVESKADSAVSTAEDANKKSDNAVSTASAAATTANDAMSTADNAVSTANSAETKADSAVSIAEDANQAAENALSEASSAQKVANAASETANQAQSVAEGIDGKASQALEVSQQAFDTAENAQTVAEGIDGKASEALTNSEQAVSTANEAKKLAEQAVAGNGTEVYVDNALQARVDFKSDPQTQINNIVSGAQVVGKATDAGNVKSQINGKNISDIFESDGTTVKKATKATQDADGNVIDETYSKLSQVVRVDAAQSLTDAQKNTVAQNIERSAGRSVNSGVGWYNILTADTNGYFVADLSVTSGYSRLEPSEVKIIAIGGYTKPGLVNTRASITCFSGGALSPFISKVRVRHIEGQVCIDVYIPYDTTTYFNDVKVAINSWKNIDNIMPQVQPFTFVGTEDDAADNVSICEVIPKGISTNGQVYQQGSPVLVGDQSAIFESDGTTVKKASKLATPRALPVNLALPSGNASKFDGSADTSLGVTGTLPVANGGTGQSNLDNVTVGNAKKATSATNADNVKTTINGKAISSIFESDGTTAKNATNAVNATKATNIIPDENGAVNPLGRKADAEVGDGSVALGFDSSASGRTSIALGRRPTASGTSSIALGYNAAASGNYSTALGSSSEALGNYSTVLGYNATASSTDSATVQLGGSALSTLRCKVNLTVTSDKRDKTDIEGITDALAFVERLNPVTFVSNDRVNYISDEDKKGETFSTYGMCEYDRIAHAAGTKKGERRRCGLIAQDVVEAMQSVYGTDNYANIVNDNFHDLAEKPSDVENKYTLAYANLVPFLIGAIKELNAKIKKLEGETIV